MRIDYLAHACFLVTGDSGVKVAFDPYEPGGFGGALRYAAPDVQADLVFTTHDHADHNAVGGIGGAPRAVRAAGPGEHRGVRWQGLAAFHDQSGGSERGKVVVFGVAVDGVSFCHLGDLGQKLTAGEAGRLGAIDVLFAPVGGYFTIDAAGAVWIGKLLKPRVLVPMHFKTPKVDFPIAPVEEFLRLSPWPVKKKGAGVDFQKASLPAATEVWLMEPSR
jgi:L-ascorbate metabolism protein UlaG (beta-lactamase superfamily)